MSWWIVKQEIEHLDLGAYAKAAESLRATLEKEIGHLYRTPLCLMWFTRSARKILSLGEGEELPAMRERDRPFSRISPCRRFQAIPKMSLCAPLVVN